MKKTKPKAVAFEKFDGCATKSSFTAIKEKLFDCARIDLVPRERIVKLNIRWAEEYCVCTPQEWEEVSQILKTHGIEIRQKTVADWFFDMLHFFVGQPLAWFKGLFK